jgi:multidrug efflux system outer membrane protein
MALVLTGCTMAPKYARPGLPVPGDWPESAAAQPAASTSETAPPLAAAQVAPAVPVAVEIPWREFFSDARLQSVIGMALANNRDLRVAVLTVEKAQALYRIQRSELYPGVGVQADGLKTRLPEKMSDGGSATIVEQYSVNLGTASWELDLFGRVRSLKDKALNQYFATDQARVAAQISLVAAVAQSYLALAADREHLALARSTLEAQRDSYGMILASRDAGIASDLDLRQAQAQVDAARVDVAQFSGFVALGENALNLLAGAPVPPEMLPDTLGAVTEMKDIRAGLPSEVLLQRPDILAAEYQLMAANANIGAARAAFFPRITLTAGLGFMSPDLSGLFDSGTRTWTFAPQIVAPIFASGSLLANLKAAKVDRDIAVAQYEKTIQNAFREVSDALALRTTLMDQQEAQESLVTALEQSYFLSEARYKAGIDGYLGVLVNQRSLYVAQRGLVQVRLARQANQVALYKVLGGGS